MIETIISTFIGIILGGFVTWWAAKHYYEKASLELTVEAKELKRLSILIIQGLESSGMVKISYDDEGNVKGIVITASGSLQAESAFIIGNGTVTPNEEK